MAINHKNFIILISLILSSQTNDNITQKIMQHLFRLGLDIHPINFFLYKTENEIKQCIQGIGLDNRKAKYIKQITAKINDMGYIPYKYEDLIKLPGVGSKNALQYIRLTGLVP